MSLHRIKAMLDVLASAACVLICVLLIITVVNSSPRAHKTADDKKHVLTAGLTLGARFPAIEGYDYAQHTKSILLFVNADCPHCIKNLPIYEKLFEAAKGRTDRPGAAVLGLFQTQAGYRAFASRGFTIPSKADLLFARFGVIATPTVVVIDRKGSISNFWVGELSEAAIQTLTQIVKSTS